MDLDRRSLIIIHLISGYHYLYQVKRFPRTNEELDVVGVLNPQQHLAVLQAVVNNVVGRVFWHDDVVSTSTSGAA